MPQGWDNEVTSIIVEGPYMAALFQHEEFTGKCQVFKHSDANLRDDPIGRCGCIIGNTGCGDCTESVVVIPLQGVTQFQGTEGSEEGETGSCNDYVDNETGCYAATESCFWYDGSCYSEPAETCSEYVGAQECSQPSQEGNCTYDGSGCIDEPEDLTCSDFNEDDQGCFENTGCYYNYDNNNCYGDLQPCPSGSSYEGCSEVNDKKCCNATGAEKTGETTCRVVEGVEIDGNSYNCLGWDGCTVCIDPATGTQEECDPGTGCP